MLCKNKAFFPSFFKATAHCGSLCSPESYSAINVYGQIGQGTLGVWSGPNFSFLFPAIFSGIARCSHNQDAGYCESFESFDKLNICSRLKIHTCCRCCFILERWGWALVAVLKERMKNQSSDKPQGVHSESSIARIAEYWKWNKIKGCKNYLIF